MKNRAIIDMIEPGSTFKIVTLSGVLNEKLVRPDTAFIARTAAGNIAARSCTTTIRSAHCSVHDVLVHSSNIGAAKLALQLGENRLYNYIKLLGFGDRTGIDLPGEIVGDGPPDQPVEQDFHHAHPDGPGRRRHADPDGRWRWAPLPTAAS